MNLSEINAAYQKGELDKHRYIDAMYACHEQLHEYSKLIADTNIASIEITAEGLHVALKSPAVKMRAPVGDRRIAPVEALNFGDYEAAEFKAIVQVLKGLGDSLQGFVDIGANAGFYSLGLKSIFSDLDIWAFEPIPHTFSVFRDNLRLNDMEGIKAYPIGLSNEAGSFIFHTYPSQSVAASREKILDDVDAVQVTCELDTLDHVVAREGIQVDFIKCDVEGAELFAFQGAKETLKTQKPLVFSEMLRKWCSKYEYHPNDLIAYFSDLNYDCYAISSSGLRACPQVDANTSETNYLFLHREKHAALMQAPFIHESL